MPARAPHSLHAAAHFKMLLVVVKGMELRGNANTFEVG